MMHGFAVAASVYITLASSNKSVGYFLINPLPFSDLRLYSPRQL